MRSDRRVRVRRLAVLGALAAVGAVVAVLLPGSSGSSGSMGSAGAVVSAHGPATSTSSRTRRPSTPNPTPTTVALSSDPGTLPQTTRLPSADDPLFQAHILDLWRAVVDGQPAEAMAFFFPLSAYIQVKAISDPAYDYQDRLIASFDQDVQTLHGLLGPAPGSATLTGVSVPAGAEWIVPGVEANKGSYWRVYGTRVSYVVGGRAASFAVTSMISWRGEWYVVHLGPIR